MRTLKSLPLLTACVMLMACGVEPQYAPANTDKSEIENLKSQIQGLELQSSTLNTLIQSDFASCPATGDTADGLTRKICQIAQAATVEVRVQISSQLQSYVVKLQNQLGALSGDLAGSNANLSVIQSQITAMQTDISTLQTQMTSANAAIVALQNLTNSIGTAITGNMVSITIGEENLIAGPMYESLLKRADNKRFNGFVEALGAPVVLGNNALVATNASATITVTSSAHGLAVGDVVTFAGLTGNRGYTAGDGYGEFSVVTAPTANTFTILFPRNATSSGSFGGNSATYRKVNGRGMSTIWKSGDASDTAVRVANLGTLRYNFIIRRKASDGSNNTAEMCYDKSNNAASFATINAAAEGGAGNILCK